MVRCRLLGGADLRAPDGRELREAITQPKRFALLVYLALAQPPGFHRRDTLLALLWPESDAVHARNALRQALHHLRGVLGEAILVNRGDEVGLEWKEFWCDAAEFERAIGTGDYASAAELYRGDLLPGFFVSEAPDFERWLDAERERMRQRAADAGWRLSAAAEQADNGPVAVHWARWAAQLTLDDEAAVRRYIELCARLGDSAGALRAYQDLVERLAREYGTAPLSRHPIARRASAGAGREPVATAPFARTVAAARWSCPAFGCAGTRALASGRASGSSRCAPGCCGNACTGRS